MLDSGGMRLTARARRAALAGVVLPPLLGALSCGLTNPLDHLQAGAGGDAESDALGTVGDGGTNGEGGSPVDGEALDADDAPGCGESRWAKCGVTIVATPKQPGDAVFTLAGVYFSDRETGELFETTCTSGGCTPPELRVSGEDRPNRMAYVPDSVFWTTATAIRRLRMVPYDASTPVETLDAIEGEAQITGKYPHALWTDAKGVRGWPLQGGLVTLWEKPSTSPTIGIQGAHMFVSEGEVKRCTWDTAGVGPVSAVPASKGAALVAWNLVFANLTVGYFGSVAAVSQGGTTGSRLLLLDQLDDAGASFVLADETAAVVSIDSERDNDAERYVYWTTAAGELRRRAKDAPGVTTLLRGLSSDTSIDVKGGLVLVTDRGSKRILSYAPP